MVFFPRKTLNFCGIYYYSIIIGRQLAVGLVQLFVRKGEVAVCSFQVFQFFIKVILVKNVAAIEEQHKYKEHRGYHDVFVFYPVWNML